MPPSPVTAPLSWLNTSFLGVAHLAGLAGAVVYFSERSPSPALWALAFCWTALTIFGLSAGYHRLFSHRTYEVHPALKLLLLGFGAAAFQNSAMVWAADHRRHHRYVDSDLDPYNARRGFWWSHIGWVLRQTPLATDMHPVPDLAGDRLVAWQNRHYPLIGLVVGFVIPALIGLALGDWWGALVLAGAVRLVLVYHITFSVNSFAHIVGRQPYSNRNTSRDSSLVAVLSMGEGYHNFHHTFPNDYRNGVRLHQFDPSKWAIRLFSTVGLAKNLRRTPQPAIARARLRIEELRLTPSLAERWAASPAGMALLGRARALRQSLDETLHRWQVVVSHHEEAIMRRDRRLLRRLRAETRLVKNNFQRTYKEWRRLHRTEALAEA